MKRLIIALLTVLFLAPISGQIAADDTESGSWSPLDWVTPGGRDIVPRPTVTGAYIWTDLVYFRGWRIQLSALTGEHRLIDPRGLRRAWGTYVQCANELKRIKKAKSLAPMEGRVVLVLHGLVRTPSAMEGLCEYIEDNSDFTVINVGYPTTLKDIGTHARYLAHLIDNLEGVEEINFVAHSMGNIVLRHYLFDQTDPKTGRQGDPRIKRFVMLAPPNNGSVAASMLAKNDFFVTLFGSAGQELGADWKQLAPRLAVPDFEFGIIAGGKADGQGYNPILKGDDDGTVRVECTKLPGAADFRVVPTIHAFIMDQPKTKEYTLRFLEDGYFESPEARRPIKK